MEKQQPYIRIPANEMQQKFFDVLIRHNFSSPKAKLCAALFTDSSADGVVSHGVNRFPRFIEYVKKGFVKPESDPELVRKIHSLEQWNGNLGPGPSNAFFATERAMQLAVEYGTGIVGLSHTNHWMRGGTYGWQAAKKGFAFIGFTNTIANMPAWGALDKRLGNNPLVIALPYKNEAIVLDMAMSQFSYGAMEQAVLKKEMLAVAGGYDRDGNLSNDPAAILETGRLIPIGYWKGAGLSLLLDMLATILTGGLSVAGITKQRAEFGLSQVFIAIDLAQASNQDALYLSIKNIVDDYLDSQPVKEKESISYPGQRVLRNREFNLANGIPVAKDVWETIALL